MRRGIVDKHTERRNRQGNRETAETQNNTNPRTQRETEAVRATDSETKKGKHRERMEREMGAVRVALAEAAVPAGAGGSWWFPLMVVGRVSETITPNPAKTQKQVAQGR